MGRPGDGVAHVQCLPALPLCPDLSGACASVTDSQQRQLELPCLHSQVRSIVSMSPLT